VEFQFFSASGSSHQSLQSAKTGFVERTAMFEIKVMNVYGSAKILTTV